MKSLTLPTDVPGQLVSEGKNAFTGIQLIADIRN